MTKPMKFFDLDKENKIILELLQDDAKTSLRDISEASGLSTTAVRARMNKLKEEGIIKKQITLIDCRQLGYREMVLASLRVNSSQPIEDIKKKIEGMLMIKYAYVITGEYPLFVMFKCLDHEDSIRQIEELRKLPGVEEVKTQMVLDRIKEDHTIIIP